MKNSRTSYSHLVRICTGEPSRLGDRHHNLHKRDQPTSPKPLPHTHETNHRSRPSLFKNTPPSLTSWLTAKDGQWRPTTSNHTDLDCKQTKTKNPPRRSDRAKEQRKSASESEGFAHLRRGTGRSGAWGRCRRGGRRTRGGWGGTRSRGGGGGGGGGGPRRCSGGRPWRRGGRRSWGWRVRFGGSFWRVRFGDAYWTFGFTNLGPLFSPVMMHLLGILAQLITGPINIWKFGSVCIYIFSCWGRKWTYEICTT